MCFAITLKNGPSSVSTGTAAGDGVEVSEARRNSKLPLSNNNSDGVHSICKQIPADAAESGSNSSNLPNGLVPIPSASSPTSHVQAFRFHITNSDTDTSEAALNGRATEPGADASADVDMKMEVDTCDARLTGDAVRADGDGEAGVAGGAGGDARRVFASDALAYLPVRPGVALRAPLTVQLTLIPVDHFTEHSPTSGTIPTALSGAHHFNSASVVASS